MIAPLEREPDMAVDEGCMRSSSEQLLCCDDVVVSDNDVDLEHNLNIWQQGITIYLHLVLWTFLV